LIHIDNLFEFSLQVNKANITFVAMLVVPDYKRNYDISFDSGQGTKLVLFHSRLCFEHKFGLFRNRLKQVKIREVT